MLKYSIWASHLKLLWWSLLIWTVPWEKSCISYLIQPLRGKHHSSRKLANLCNKSPVLLPLLQTAGWKDISSGFTIKSQSLKEELEVCYHMFSVTILTCGLASRNSPFYPLGKALLMARTAGSSSILTPTCHFQPTSWLAKTGVIYEKALLRSVCF